MKTAEITDPEFRAAVEAIDTGNLAVLEAQLDAHPRLLTEPLDYASGDYFQHPYLLWFIADNPIRNGKLAPNILEVTRLLIRRLHAAKAPELQRQLEYAVALVSTGKTPAESGFQLNLLDLLRAAGGKSAGALSSLCHSGPAAAEYYLHLGEPLTLPLAVGLRRRQDIPDQFAQASEDDRRTAVIVAAFYGQAEILQQLLSLGAPVNGFSTNPGFHRHGTALHQAVSSADLESVQLLVEAGADLAARDTIHHATPLDWANHMRNQADGERYEAVRQYLSEQSRS